MLRVAAAHDDRTGTPPIEHVGASNSDHTSALVVESPARPEVTDCEFVANYRDVRGHEAAFEHFAANQAIYWVQDTVDDSGAAIWPAGTYRMWNDDVVIGPTSTLLLLPGATVELLDRFEDLIVEGAVFAQGTGENRVVFRGTSSAVQGSTLVLRDNPGPSHLLNVLFEHLGALNSDHQAALLVESGDVLLESCEFTGGEGRGIDASSSSVVVRRSAFHGNGTAVRNQTPASVVDAVENWWGDPSGPTHSGNPGGVGDTVSDGVSYDLWLTGEPFFELSIVPNVVLPDMTTTFAAGNGAPGSPLLLFIVAVNGTPRVRLLFTARFDGFQQWRRSLVIPPGLSGTTIDFSVFGTDLAGDIAQTPAARLTFL